jgi:hypothetical protein
MNGRAAWAAASEDVNCDAIMRHWQPPEGPLMR